MLTSLFDGFDKGFFCGFYLYFISNLLKSYRHLRHRSFKKISFKFNCACNNLLVYLQLENLDHLVKYAVISIN